MQNKEKLMEFWIFHVVQEAIQRWVEAKAKTYEQVVSVGSFETLEPVYKITPRFVADLYGDRIRPLTKEVQVEYLLRRLD